MQAGKTGRLIPVLLCLAIVGVGVALFLPAVERGCVPDPRMLSHNNLRNIGVAFEHYYAQNGGVPQGKTGNGEQPEVSWRVLLLPFLEQEDLYSDYNQSQSWTSPMNRRLGGRMPTVYSIPGQKGAPYTNYLAVKGEGSLWQTMANMARGNSQTFPAKIIVAEVVNRNVHWLSPTDLDTSVLPWRLNDPSAMGISGPYRRNPGAQVLLWPSLVEFLPEVEVGAEALQRRVFMDHRGEGGWRP